MSHEEFEADKRHDLATRVPRWTGGCVQGTLGIAHEGGFLRYMGM